MGPSPLQDMKNFERIHTVKGKPIMAMSGNAQNVAHEAVGESPDDIFVEIQPNAIHAGSIIRPRSASQN